MKNLKPLYGSAAMLVLCISASPLYAQEKQFKTQLGSNAIGSACLSAAIDPATLAETVALGSCDLKNSRWEVTAVDGDKYRITSLATALCLASEAGTGSLVQAPCGRDNTTLWSFALVSELTTSANPTTVPAGIVTKVSIGDVPTEVDGGFYELRNVSNGTCADGVAGGQAAGTPVVPYGCHGGYNQHWFVSQGVPEPLEK